MAEPAPARRGERGFTLVEVLVAMAVLGIVLGTVYRIYGSGMLAVTRNADELRLALVADALLERALLDLDPRRGELRGELAGGLEWRLSAAPLELPRALDPEPAVPGEASAEQLRLWELRVVVADARGASFALHTLRLAGAR